MTTTTTTTCTLPTPLLQTILRHTWLSPLTAFERITLLTSAPLVSKSFSAAFRAVSQRDVYVPSLEYLHYVLQPLFYSTEHTAQEVKNACRTISVCIDYRSISPIPGIPGLGLSVSTAVPLRGYADEPFMGHTLRMLLDFISILNNDTNSEFSNPRKVRNSKIKPSFPNLRKVRVEFADMSFGEDIFVNGRFAHFPRCVEELEMVFSWSDGSGGVKGNQMRHEFEPLEDACFLGVKRLKIVGGSEGVIADVVGQCPNLEILEVGLEFGGLGGVSNTHLVSLCESGVAINLEGAFWYSLGVDEKSGVRRFRRRQDKKERSRRVRFTRVFSKLFSKS